MYRANRVYHVEIVQRPRRVNVQKRNPTTKKDKNTQRMSAAPKITTKAPTIDPFATPNDALAAPPAGGASAAPVGLELPDAAAEDAEPDGVIELRLPVALADEAPDADGVDEKLALGPTALFDTVLTSPLTVARLLTTLASVTLLVALPTVVLALLLLLAVLGNVT
jgi:hypothetical protein